MSLVKNIYLSVNVIKHVNKNEIVVRAHLPFSDYLDIQAVKLK